MNTSLFTTKTERDKRPFEVIVMQLAHTSDLSFLLHIKTNASYHLSHTNAASLVIQTRLEKHMRVAELFMTCSWTLTEQRFIHKSKVMQQQKLYAGVGDRRRDLDRRKCGVGGRERESVWWAWETSFYSDLMMMEGCVMCAHVFACACLCGCVCFMCAACLRNASLWLSACPLGFRLMSPLGCCLEILHPEHTHMHIEHAHSNYNKH